MSTHAGTRVHALVDGRARCVALGMQEGALNAVLAGLPLGVYSGLRTFGGDRFLDLEAHLDRTERSARALGFTLEPDRADLVRALADVARERAPADARVRFDVLPAPVEALGARARIWITSAQLEPPPARFLEQGVGVGLAAGLRRERPLVKTTDFPQRRRPYPLGSQETYEHLMLDGDGHVLEGTSSNFFAVQDGRLLTAGEGVLEGVTRAIVLRLAEELGVEVDPRGPLAREAERWDEAFLTSSSRGLVPVVAVEGRTVGAGRPGPLTRRLLEAYGAYVAREALPALAVPEGSR